MQELTAPDFDTSKRAANLPTQIFDIRAFIEVIKRYKDGNKEVRRREILKLVSLDGLIIHHVDKSTEKCIVSDSANIQYEHEHHTAQKLVKQGYNVVFVPKGYFGRDEKRFNVFLCLEHAMIEADLKCVHSSNPDTIGKRIKEGAKQAAIIVLDVHSTINKKA